MILLASVTISHLWFDSQSQYYGYVVRKHFSNMAYSTPQVGNNNARLDFRVRKAPIWERQTIAYCHFALVSCMRLGVRALLTQAPAITAAAHARTRFRVICRASSDMRPAEMETASPRFGGRLVHPFVRSFGPRSFSTSWFRFARHRIHRCRER